MSKFPFSLLLVCIFFSSANYANEYDIKKLREQYAQPVTEWPTAHIDAGVEFNELGLLPDMAFPKENPFSLEKMRLGEKLFNDGRLSRSKQFACASCHEPDLAWADGRKKSFGHNRQKGKRNAPSIENIGFSNIFFWDGRASTLEAQSLMPIIDSTEMNFSLPELEERLNNEADYKPDFKAAFGDEEVTSERIAQALATFQRTIVSRRSDFDTFVKAASQTKEKTRQNYLNKLSDKALLGLHLFRTKARCINCHSGPTFSDNQFHNIGLTFYKRRNEDLGRYNVTHNPDDVGKFKTPSLRGVMNTGPWMHNGLFIDMRGILNLYNSGMVAQKSDPNDPLSPKLSPMIKPLALTSEELDALEAFLNSITARPATGPSRQIIKMMSKQQTASHIQ